MVPLLIPSSCSSVWYLGFGSDLSPSKVGHIFEMNYCFNCYGRMRRHCTIILYHSFIQGSTLYKKKLWDCAFVSKCCKGVAIVSGT